MNVPLPFEWIAAIRFLREGGSQTAMTVVGAAVGVAVIVFMSALISGVQANIFNRVLSTQAHIIVSPIEEVARPLRDAGAAMELAIVQKPAQRLRSIEQWQALSAGLLARDGVVAVSPSASGAAFALRGEAAKTISLSGIEPAQYYKILDLPSKLTVGTAALGASDILIGVELANDLGVSVGEKLRVQTNAGTSGATESTFVIVGLFDLGNKEANTRTAFVAFRRAQSLLGLQGGVSSISVNLVDPYQAEMVAAELRTSLGVNAESWIESLAQLFTALRSQTIANFVIRFFVALSVALGIASVLFVSVVQRSREIGILRAMGTTRGQILRVFLIQGAVVGLVGSIVGSLIGMAFVFVWRVFARNPDGTEFFPIVITTDLIAGTALIATLTGVLTTLPPALQASWLNPVDAIRG